MYMCIEDHYCLSLSGKQREVHLCGAICTLTQCNVLRAWPWKQSQFLYTGFPLWGIFWFCVSRYVVLSEHTTLILVLSEPAVPVL